MWGMRVRHRILGDDQLVKLAARGSLDAEAEIFVRHHRELVGYCRSILLDAHEADEAAQAAIVKAVEALRRRPLGAPLRPWLFRIAHNEAIDLLRHRRSQDPLDRVTAVVPSAEVTAEQRERVAQLVADLHALPERQRSALLMREMNGLSYPEIAVSLAASEQAVRQTVFEARRALTEYGEGRALKCSSVRSVLEAGDRRLLRGRRLRAHLRGCADCGTLQAGIAARRRDLRLLVPALPASGLALLGGAGAATSGAVKVAVGLVAAMTATVGVTELPAGHTPARRHRALAARPHKQAARKPPTAVRRQAAPATLAPIVIPRTVKRTRRDHARPIVAPAPAAAPRRRHEARTRPVQPRAKAPAVPVVAPAPTTTAAPTATAPLRPAYPAVSASARAAQQAILDAALADAQRQVAAATARARQATQQAMDQAQSQLAAAMALLDQLQGGSIP